MASCWVLATEKAELDVIHKALEWVEERICDGTAPVENVVIFTDSISALETLEGQSAGLGKIFLAILERL